MIVPVLAAIESLIVAGPSCPAHLLARAGATGQGLWPMFAAAAAIGDDPEA